MGDQSYQGWPNRMGQQPFAFPRFDFSRPPPPIQAPRHHVVPPQFFHHRPLGLPHTSSRKEGENSNEDNVWVQQWLIKRNKPEQTTQKRETEPRVKISEVKMRVHKLEEIMNELEFLKSSEESSQRVASLKNEALEITEFLKASQSQMVLSVKNRAKKRNLEKLRRQKRRAEKEKLILDRQAKHRQIDAWLQQQQEQVEKAKREEEMRKQADAVLCEVRQKQSFGKGFLQVLESLKKLRLLRAQAAADKKLFPTEEENERFNTMIGKLEDLWQLQLAEYGKEEQTLRVMLEEEKVNHQEKQQPSSFERNLKLWLMVLFGKEKGCVSDFESFHQNVNGLVSIRQCWDQFVVPRENILASSIPVGWVVPSKPSSDDWKELLGDLEKQ
ncbi:programmed cell death protein 7-like [Cloeon dipterum]|uniref:programmed cell death protein 7-like n=1 Tax=Cloeon dipterum TaxID=197152 RepID=UPI0032203F84